MVSFQFLPTGSSCHDCANFDLCQLCYSNNTHDGSHAFALIATEGATPIPLVTTAAKPAAKESPLQARPVGKQPYSSLGAHHETFKAASSTSPCTRYTHGPSKRRDDGDSAPPNLTESNSRFSSSSFSSQQPHQKMSHSTADHGSSFLDLSSSRFSERQPFTESDVSLKHAIHHDFLCHGPKCRGATRGIVGPRYMCAICPTSVDLCEDCYMSQTVHTMSHAFLRLDPADDTAYVMCPLPQQQQQQRQHQPSRQEERHANIFCDGFKVCVAA